MSRVRCLRFSAVAAARTRLAAVFLCPACAALVFMGGGCDRPLSLAIGPAGDITVFSDLPAESPELATLVEGLEREVSFIGKPELTFNVELAGRDGFDLRRHWRNLVFVGSLDEGSWVSEMIAGLLSEENMSDLRRGKQEIFFIKDRWAIGQMIAIVSSAEGDELAAAVEGNIGVLYEMMDRAAVENTRRILLRKDVKRDAARYLLSEYGWSLTLPEGFEGTEDSDHGVAFFKTEEPSRIILVHWRDEFKEDLTPETCLAIRGEIAWNYYDEDRIDRELTTVSRSEFADRDAVKLDGIWQNDKHVNGGPFRSYCFAEGGRFYLIDMVLFAPGDDKLPYLRELEAIAMTFSTE